tara:strand:+ start:2051 stop:2215 length:165 start_codon:yes stop_codon:yes gene_type:complete
MILKPEKRLLLEMENFPNMVTKVVVVPEARLQKVIAKNIEAKVKEDNTYYVWIN